jgi:hypothetical protein
MHRLFYCNDLRVFCGLTLLTADVRAMSMETKKTTSLTHSAKKSSSMMLIALVPFGLLIVCFSIIAVLCTCRKRQKPGLRNIHSTPDDSDNESVPPPLPDYNTRCEDVEQQPPATSIVTSASKHPYVQEVFDAEQQNRMNSGVCEQNQPEPNTVVYAELAVTVRPERVHRTFIADHNRAVYASIDHRIKTTKNL